MISYKLDFTLTMKKVCLEFAMIYKDWTINDLKKVIWADETSAVLGQHRVNNCIGRTIQKSKKWVTATRQKGDEKFIEFMF